MTNRITAVFPNQNQAEEAITELKSLGVHEADLSFIARQAGDQVTTGTAQDLHDHDSGKGAGRGLAVGATAGAIFGLAAALIPGVGPFITAGFLATSLGAAAGGAVAGAVVGGVTGTLAGALADAGYDRHEAEFYERHLNEGGVLVAVEPPAHVMTNQVADVLTRHGGILQNGVTGSGYSDGVAGSGYSTATTSADYTTTDTSARLGDLGDRRTDSYTETDTRNLRPDVTTGTHRNVDVDEEARLQLREERLEVEKERFVAGSVEVGKRVETRTENVNVELQHEEIVIERHPVSGERAVEGNIQLGADRETIRVDLEAERADVEKRAFVTEEVEIGKRTETERQTFTETVGKEVLEVNRTGDVDIRADQTATGTLRESTRDVETELETNARLEREARERDDLNRK